jgi:hypothetical protein
MPTFGMSSRLLTRKKEGEKLKSLAIKQRGRAEPSAARPRWERA